MGHLPGRGERDLLEPFRRGSVWFRIVAPRFAFRKGTQLAIASRSTVHAGAEKRQGGGALLDANPEVRNALARELHDRVAQKLATVLMDLEVFKTEQVGQDAVLNRVDLVQGSMREVLGSLRDLLHELRDESVGFSGDLRDGLLTLLISFERRTGIETSLIVKPGWPAHTRPAAGLQLYRIAEEALMNAGRHSGAKRVRVTLNPVGDDELCMSVTDYGRGFDETTIAAGMGTLGMRERAVLIGARLWIDAFPGFGTTVQVTLPRSQLTSTRE
jgi:two-component system sensor histidine kinase UhpB